MANRAKVFLPLILTGTLGAPCLATQTAPASPAEEQPIDEAIEEAIVPPQAIAKTQKAPDYPPAARAARFDGTVQLSLTILPDGTVGRVEVVECDHPNVGFESASIEAAKRWKFVPAKKGGEAVEYVTTFRITFRTGTGSGTGKVLIRAGSTPESPADARQVGDPPPTSVPAPPRNPTQKR
jgi:TonB family protein